MTISLPRISAFFRKREPTVAKTFQNLERNLAQRRKISPATLQRDARKFVRRDILFCSEAVSFDCSITGLRVNRCWYAEPKIVEPIFNSILGSQLNRRSITAQTTNDRYVVVLAKLFTES
jgi:hypothetical protein